METSLAKAAMDIVKRRDPKNLNNKMSLEDLQKLAPSFQWKQYVTLLHTPPSPTYLVTSPVFFRWFGQLIDQQPLDHWKAYLRWHLVHRGAPYLGRAVVAENFNVGRERTGAKELPPRWRRCVHSTDGFLGEALGQAYVARAFPPESKERVLKMVHAIEGALEQDVTELNWMAPETKSQAKAKLHMILDKIGYPDHWRDYSTLEITPDSYFQNVNRSTAFEFNRQLHKIGTPMNRKARKKRHRTNHSPHDPKPNHNNSTTELLRQ